MKFSKDKNSQEIEILKKNHDSQSVVRCSSSPEHQICIATMHDSTSHTINKNSQKIEILKRQKFTEDRNSQKMEILER